MSKRYSFFQNHVRLIVIGLLLVILVSACGNSATPQPAESLLSQIEAAVTATPTATPLPPPTATPRPTRTPRPMRTPMPATGR